MFTVRHTTHNLRGTHMLTLSKLRTTTYGLRSFFYFSAQQWNALPHELRNSTFPDFKRRFTSFTNFGLALCVSFRDRNFFLKDISYIA